ncbi:hypothetical protein LEMA_P068740.1 [Plenodomus lingam JN3]|uniref:Non-homologous end-joining factor 1 n=1 Tax=Leptosphaeria maculans (strain JN3 / isolate v23.1.3 / race Av1-4-5-6-7-8) TaxID=985895 RepID=E4ZJT1_LEPMJ|nr:hypothetical protein LEMA_P068740.1 [Plenodomus lingam JN3]CBX91366.1 hypothetical protein LEMA_P068740.1 [Plenodomus lingam JN3]
MSCWRLLPLVVQSNDKPLPQLLVKPDFTLDSYKLYVTDLSNIWAEELGLEDIVGRASTEQTPIEVSKHDTTQLAILLDNIKKALTSSEDALCRITRSHGDGFTLHTSVALPKPLDSLKWKHHLEKRTSIILKNELILPLLVSSHIQHERISGLISTIYDKDKAINRLLDQYESSNLDLAAAFPSIGSLKAGRRTIKREQAVKHIPELQPFSEEPWREHTGQLKDSSVTTLGLFEEALVHSTPNVPRILKSEENGDAWWFEIPNTLAALEDTAMIKVEKSYTKESHENSTSISSDGETEDEFETHENFKKRNAPHSSDKAIEDAENLALLEDEDANTSTEDEDDLDVPRKSLHQRQNQSLGRQSKSPTVTSPSPAPSVESESLQQEPVRPKTELRTGATAKPTRKEICSPPEATSSSNPKLNILPSRESVPPFQMEIDSLAKTSPKKALNQFKIGGKAKRTENESSQRGTTSPRANRVRTTASPTVEPPSSSPRQASLNGNMTVPDIHEETPEEKAVRKRAELKRKKEEATRKQAGQRKKKRF